MIRRIKSPFGNRASGRRAYLAAAWHLHRSARMSRDRPRSRGILISAMYGRSHATRWGIVARENESPLVSMVFHSRNSLLLSTSRLPLRLISLILRAAFSRDKSSLRLNAALYRAAGLSLSINAVDKEMFFKPVSSEHEREREREKAFLSAPIIPAYPSLRGQLKG